jgi:hypothetical protein
MNFFYWRIYSSNLLILYKPFYQIILLKIFPYAKV